LSTAVLKDRAAKVSPYIFLDQKPSAHLKKKNISDVVENVSRVSPDDSEKTKHIKIYKNNSC
jgi:hypothetical protein